MPTREQVARAMQEMESIRPRYRGPSGDRPGRAGLLRAPAEGLHGRLGAPLAERHAVRPRAAVPRRRDAFPACSSGRCATSRCWRSGGGLRRFRHSAAPTGCRSRAAPASMREIDFGGCRCQAMAITGDAAATDPACELSPHHARMLALAEQDPSGGRATTRIAAVSCATRLLPFQLTERRGRVARIVVVEQLPSVPLRAARFRTPRARAACPAAIRRRVSCASTVR